MHILRIRWVPRAPLLQCTCTCISSSCCICMHTRIRACARTTDVVLYTGPAGWVPVPLFQACTLTHTAAAALALGKPPCLPGHHRWTAGRWRPCSWPTTWPQSSSLCCRWVHVPRVGARAKCSAARTSLPAKGRWRHYRDRQMRPPTWGGLLEGAFHSGMRRSQASLVDTKPLTV